MDKQDAVKTPEKNTIDKDECIRSAKIEDFEKALDLFNSYIEIYPNESEAYHWRAYVKLRQEKYKDAIQDCDQSLKLNGNEVAAFNNKGICYRNLKQYRNSFKSFKKSLQIASTYNPRAYYNRANVYYETGQYKQAIEDFNKAISQNPEYKRAYYGKALSLYRQDPKKNHLLIMESLDRARKCGFPFSIQMFKQDATRKPSKIPLTSRVKYISRNFSLFLRLWFFKNPIWLFLSMAIVLTLLLITSDLLLWPILKKKEPTEEQLVQQVKTKTITITTHDTTFTTTSYEPVIVPSISETSGKENIFSELFEGILVEANGFFFDVFFFGIIITVYEIRRKKIERNQSNKEKIRSYEQEIDDLRKWKNSPEPAHRIAGLIRRLNELGKTSIDLHNVKLTDVTLSTFSLTNYGGEWNNVPYEVFETEQVVNLTNGFFYQSEISDSHMQGIVLYNATLTKTNFSNSDLTYADMREASFKNCILTGANLDYARVSFVDFFEQLQKKGTDITDLVRRYKISPYQLRDETNNFNFFQIQPLL